MSVRMLSNSIFSIIFCFFSSYTFVFLSWFSSLSISFKRSRANFFYYSSSNFYYTFLCFSSYFSNSFKYYSNQSFIFVLYNYASSILPIAHFDCAPFQFSHFVFPILFSFSLTRSPAAFLFLVSVCLFSLLFDNIYSFFILLVLDYGPFIFNIIYYIQ